MALSTQLAYLVAAILQVFLYGLYLVSLAHALRWLLYDEDGWTLKSREKVKWSLSAITVILFVLSTTDVTFIITRLVTYTISSGSGGEAKFDGGGVITLQLTIASVAIENTTLLITDAVLIIRCWLVYQKSRRVVFLPIVLWLANLTFTILWLVSFTIFVNNPSAQESVITSPSFQVLYSCHFATNLYATSAIIYRVWSVARENNGRTSILFRASRIIATTGILYTCTSLPAVVMTFYIETIRPGYLLCDALNFSMAGITFNLLQIRVGQLRAGVETYDHESASSTRESVLLSTVQFNVSTIAANDRSLDSTSTRQRRLNDANIQEK
ncbi:hypothetical protein JOM56_014076 [Amanita muscaria]